MNQMHEHNVLSRFLGEPEEEPNQDMTLRV